MKKRIISMLLTVLMVMSLFSGISVNAYAATTTNGANTIDYTMAQGDYVLRICQRLGLNYYTCKDAIMKLNGITDGQWNQLTVGRTLTLPASDYDALLISNANTVTYNANGLVSTASQSSVTGTASTGASATTLSTTNTNTAASADVLGYYLVPYTMSSGETVSGVCNSMGVNFAIFGPFVKQVNNISNWNKVRAGDTLIIPTPMAPSVGTTCYGVMEHIVTNSDTAYGIVSSNGVNYNANERLLKVLNQTENLAAIKAGTKFFYPVPLTVAVPGTGNPGSTSTTTTTTTVTDGNGTTTTQTTTTSKLYKLSSGMSASDGTMLFYVDNQAVTAAVAGAKVTVVTDTASGKAIQSLTVKNSDGSADFLMTGDTFIMPSCDVRVDAVVKTGHNINISANYSGKATASVDGISVQSAVKGATVIIKSIDPNYEISAVYASYKKLISATSKTQLQVSSSKAFIMPDADADVEVVLKPVSTYAFYANDPDYGSFYLEVNGSAVTRAAKGAKVTVVAKAENGYEPKSVTVKNHSTQKDISLYANSFTMPAADVDVIVTFGGKGNNILIMPSEIATVHAFTQHPINVTTKWDDDAVTEAETGTKVYLLAADETNTTPAAIADKDYNIAYNVVRNSDGLKVSVENKLNADATTNLYSFTMPKGGVTVTPVITSKEQATVKGEIYVNNDKASTYKDCSFSVTYNDAGQDKRVEYNGKSNPDNTKISSLQYVDLRYDVGDGVAFIRYEIEVKPSYKTGADDTAKGKADALAKEYQEELQNEANLHGYFQIPAVSGDIKSFTITIKAYFETGKVGIGPAAITGIGTVGYRDVNGNSINSAEPGKEVRVYVYPGDGFKFDYSKYTSRLVVTRKDNGAQIELTPVNMKDKEGANATDKSKMASCEYFKFTMPAEGVNVQAIFEAKPFVITMICQDQNGNNLTGRGLWQVAINMEPGVVDNDPNKKETKFTVAYEDYVTVAMTEAGWSKYDMVSFVVDGQKYTADSLNFFYYFQMIGDRAKDLTIVAILQPKTIALGDLYANYDSTKGNVEFLILDDPSGYAKDYLSTVTTNAEGKKVLSSSQFVKKAMAGDKVAIAAIVNDKMYTVNAKDISVMSYGSDADGYQVAEELYYIDGKPVTLFTFTMPAGSVVVDVPFSSYKYSMTVKVTDSNGNAVGGMVNVSVDGQTFGDAAADNSFGKVDYNALVTILPSMKASADGKRILKVDVKTNVGSEPVYYFNYSGDNGGSGPAFSMPASDVTVFITVDEYILINTFDVVNQLTGGTLIFRKGPAMTDERITKAADINVGDTIYVFEVPNSGKAHLGKGDLKITQNGVVYTVANWYGEAADGTNIWEVKIPAGVLVFTAEWPDKETEKTTGSNLIYAPASAVTGGTLQFYLPKTTEDVPDTSIPATEYDPNEYLYILATPGTGYKTLTADDIKVVDSNYAAVTVHESDHTSTTPGAKWFYLDKNLTEGGIAVNAEFPSEGYKITFKLESGTTNAAALNLGSRSEPVTDDTTGITLTLDAGDRITISSGDAQYNMVKVTSVQYDTSFTESAVTYVVPAEDDTVTIKVFSGNAAVKVNLTTDSKYGTIGLAHSDSTAMIEQPSAFKIGDEFYFFASPAYGYELDTENTTVVENIGNKIHKIAAGDIVESGGIYSVTDMEKIPDGGITVNAAFKAKKVKITFTLPTAGSVQISDGSSSFTIQEGVSVETTYNKKVTMTPVGDFKWGPNAATSDKVTISGSGATSARTFTVSTVDDITVTLDVVAKS